MNQVVSYSRMYGYNEDNTNNFPHALSSSPDG